MRLLRSLAAGGLATLVDLAVLAILVACAVDARIANVPALLAGAAVSFFGHRHFAFRAGGGPLGRQALGFSAVEIVSLLLNGFLFDLATRALAGHGHALWIPLATRLVVSHAVYLAWSYPLWRLVFRRPAEARATT